MGARITIRKVRLAGFARSAGALSVPTLVLAGLANRFDLMPFYAVLPALVFGFLLAIGAFVMAVFAMTTIWHDGGRGTGSAVAGLIYSLPGLLLAGVAVFAVLVYPRIADVTTNAEDPPQFEVLRPAGASTDMMARRGNSPVAIPGTGARLYPAGIDNVYGAIANIIADRRWNVVLADAPGAEDGTARIEAIAKTLLFAFKDNVAIRLIGTPDGTRVDMRSASRWGRHDLGQNGRRIRAFMADLDGALQGLFTTPEEPAEGADEEVTEEPGEEPAAVPAGQDAQ